MAGQLPVVVGITGATGTVYGVRLLSMLNELGVRSHAILTRSAVLTMKLETDFAPHDVTALADEVHAIGDVGATISSGSYKTAGMIVAPCSIKTLSGVVNCYEDNLLLRAAGVNLKEGRRLVLVVRETPLHRGQLRLMLAAAETGATIFPPVPAFYTKPQSLDAVVDQTCARVLDQFGFDVQTMRWEGAHQRLSNERGGSC